MNTGQGGADDFECTVNSLEDYECLYKGNRPDGHCKVLVGTVSGAPKFYGACCFPIEGDVECVVDIKQDNRDDVMFEEDFYKEDLDDGFNSALFNAELMYEDESETSVYFSVNLSEILDQITDEEK